MISAKLIELIELYASNLTTDVARDFATNLRVKSPESFRNARQARRA